MRDTTARSVSYSCAGRVHSNAVSTNPGECSAFNCRACSVGFESLSVSTENSLVIHVLAAPAGRKAIMRVALYARVSTTDKGQNPEMQLCELREYVRNRDWETVSEFCDYGVSGSKESRPQLNRLLAGARARKFDGVLVWKLDRFGRSLKHLVNSLAEFESLGITFVPVAVVILSGSCRACRK